ncbi:MAG: hypothetical protein KGQ59_07690, partial [Bdellovibrionales bacterium]|nr:hypothetical protein [Bdellovibrionales bacterium]
MSTKNRPVSVRSVNSRGIAGILSPNGKAFHEVFYNSGGLGRSADLVAAKFRDSSPDELSIHILFLMGVLGTSRVFRAISPIRFECGVDESGFALSFSFELADFRGLVWEGISERIAAGLAQSPLDDLLLSMARHCDYLLVKCFALETRVEVCTLNYWGPCDGSSLAPVEVAMIADVPEDVPEIAEYTALGDLDYTNLLAALGADHSSPVTGEVIAHQARSMEELLIQVKSKNFALSDSELIFVSGDHRKQTDYGSFEASSMDPEAQSVTELHSDSLMKPTRPQQTKKTGMFSWLSSMFKEKSETVFEDSLSATDSDSSGRQGEVAANHQPTVSEGSAPMNTMVSDLQRLLNEGNFGNLVSSLSAETQTPVVHKFTDSMIAELNEERRRVLDLSKNLANLFRMKEAEFR